MCKGLKQQHEARFFEMLLRVWEDFLGAEQGDGTWCFMFSERKADLFKHSFKHPGVVGRIVLTLSFSFQSENFFLQLKFKESLKNVLFVALYPSECLTKQHRAKG